MKKAILSVIVVIVFSAYSVHQKINGAVVSTVALNDPDFSPLVSLPEMPQDGSFTVSSNVGVSTGPDKANQKSSLQSQNTTTQPETQTANTQTSQSAPISTPEPEPTPTPAPIAPLPVELRPVPAQTSIYRDGQYSGSLADAFYGNIKVQAVISGGQLTDVIFLDYPQDRANSIRINSQAMPILRSEAIQVQSANVDIVSGATASSQAFQESLAFALAQAKN